MLKCREATRLFSESQERSLTLHEKTVLRLHVMMCSSCRHCQRHMNILRTATRAYVKGASENKDE